MVSAAVRLATFNIPQYARMTMVDEMDFGSLGEKKKAIFCVIPVDDSSMNYLVGMLYTQCFQALYRRADEKHNGRLPVPVRVIQDEWANVAQPESYPKILATCRSYNIGLNIIVQNIQQIKALYPCGDGRSRERYSQAHYVRGIGYYPLAAAAESEQQFYRQYPL